jgi:hypothetical protein
MIALTHIDSSAVHGVFSEALKLTLLGGVLAITQVLIGICFAAGVAVMAFTIGQGILPAFSGARPFGSKQVM